MTTHLPFTHLAKPLTIGVVGLGSMGQRYAKIFSNHPEIVIHGCDPRGDKDDLFNPQTGWQFLSVEELVHKVPLNVVAIAVPASQHLAVLRTVKEAHPKCAVLLEKPVSDHALSEDERAWCLQLQGLNAVGYNWRFHPFAKQLWKAREDICNLTLHVAQDMREWPSKTYCDPLREFSHELDLVQHLTESPVIASSRLHQNEWLNESEATRYEIQGHHKRGQWKVSILPFAKARVRWIRVQMSDGAEVFREWEQTEDIIDAMYRNEAQQLLDA